MLHEIIVVSLGPGDPRLMTLEAADTLRSAKHLVLRTSQHGAAQWLEAQGVAYDTFDALYEQYEDFDELHAAMAERLWSEAATGPVTFAVIDAATDGAVRALRASKPEGGVVVECFWKEAEKSGLWVRGTYGTAMSKALEELAIVETINGANGEYLYTIFKLK